MGYRRSVCRTDDTRLGGLTALVGAGYFFVWSLLGAAVFAIGASIAAAEMRWSALARTAPMLAGVVVLSAGLIQFTEWKARRLACCRERQQRVGGVDGAPADAGWAWRHGVYLGMQMLPLLRGSHGGTSGHRGHGCPRNDRRRDRHHARASRTGRRTRRAGSRHRRRRNRVVIVGPGGGALVDQLCAKHLGRLNIAHVIGGGDGADQCAAPARRER